ncbi:949_t:CDS:1 [Paraglomus occultum]|uniref:949_t:CDS:1 n=1 Tax=Paraglomus occultum TaxID=144539 RepID=A0A9N9D2T6_9GLOM|nr:949_t:CDS:1 [Paraglomus occultum]
MKIFAFFLALTAITLTSATYLETRNSLGNVKLLSLTESAVNNSCGPDYPDYYQCPSGNGCCPTGTDCLDDTYCNMLCTVDDTPCGAGCCYTDQTCKPDGSCVTNSGNSSGSGSGNNSSSSGGSGSSGSGGSSSGSSGGDGGGRPSKNVAPKAAMQLSNMFLIIIIVVSIYVFSHI